MFVFESYISKRDKNLLKLFGKYDKLVDWVQIEILGNECCGVVNMTICKEDFDNITDEMEKYFKGRDEFQIEVDWNLNAEFVNINWDYQ